MTKTVTLTAGHSNTDPGAVNGSDREADIAQDMRNIVASILRNDYGLEVKTDGDPSMEIWAVYLGIVGGYAVARSFVSVKRQEVETEAERGQ